MIYLIKSIFPGKISFGESELLIKNSVGVVSKNWAILERLSPFLTL